MCVNNDLYCDNDYVRSVVERLSVLKIRLNEADAALITEVMSFLVEISSEADGDGYPFTGKVSMEI